MKQNKIILLIAIIIILGVAGVGVYSYYAKDSQPSGNSSEEKSTGINTQDQKDSNKQTVEGGLVDGFPSDAIPLYPGGDVVESSQTTNFMGKPEYTVHIQTSDAPQVAAERLETDYMNEGWDIKSYPTDKSFVSHSNKYIVTIQFTDNEDGTLIRYYISVK